MNHAENSCGQTVAARPLPHDLDAERALLGAAVLDVGGLDAGRATMPEGGRAFHRELHGKLWDALAGMRDRGTAWDEITLKEGLTAAGIWEDIRGFDGIGGLMTCCADWRRAGVYAGRVRGLYQQRQAANILWHAQNAATDPEAAPADALARAAELVGDVQRLLVDARPALAGTEFAEVLRELLDCADSGRPLVRTLSTGCELLDESGGLACGEFLGLVGSPGVGKSLLADLLTLCALRAEPNATALTIGLETSPAVRAARLVAGQSVEFGTAGQVARCVPLAALLRGGLSAGALSLARDSAARLTDEIGNRWTFRTDLTSGPAIANAVRTTRPALLVVDHIGMLDLSGTDATAGLDAALGQIQAALRETGAAAVLVHELNKHALTNGASMAAPRGSARFASLAGALLALVRDEGELLDATDPLISLRLLKCRHGRAGVEQAAQLLGGLGHIKLVPGVRPTEKGA